MSITTKSGDKGETGLIGGSRVKKDDAHIEAVGNVDELNAAIGLVMALEAGENDANFASGHHFLSDVQKDLFVLGAELATPVTVLVEQKNYSKSLGSRSRSRITTRHVEKLEAAIIAREKNLPPQRHFILPSGSEEIARLHMARSICRRAERRVASLLAQEPQRNEALKYLNRLSDLLFLMARESAKRTKVEEIAW